MCQLSSFIQTVTITKINEYYKSGHSGKNNKSIIATFNSLNQQIYFASGESLYMYIIMLIIKK